MDRLFRNILRDALEELASESTEMYSDFSEISKDSSNEKEALIDRYIKASRSIALKHRIAIIVIAAIIIAFSSCAIYLFKEEIGGFFVTHFNDHANLEYNTESHTEINIYYIPTKIPEGFEISSIEKETRYMNTTWVKGTDKIKFSQTLIGSGTIKLDTENAEHGEITFGNTTAYYTRKKGIRSINWMNDSCSFLLTCPDVLPLDEVEKMIISIEPMYTEDGSDK